MLQAGRQATQHSSVSILTHNHILFCTSFTLLCIISRTQTLRNAKDDTFLRRSVQNACLNTLEHFSQSLHDFDAALQTHNHPATALRHSFHSTHACIVLLLYFFSPPPAFVCVSSQVEASPAFDLMSPSTNPQRRTLDADLQMKMLPRDLLDIY